MIGWLVRLWRNRHDKGLDALAPKFAHRYVFTGTDEPTAAKSAQRALMRYRRRQALEGGRGRKAEQRGNVVPLRKVAK